ncbi:MAG: Glu-tRNAGln amidotransferase subunit [Candidatus Diapherotrites archaeon]|nr:Glu-tRNAGln amidotransferase subunit [Candidatus Diapherotrites archaeon]MDN5366785.1 Glu-tRNAGln amidotransferase subunit [Candidatus Diapherotrites archaeon]
MLTREELQHIAKIARIALTEEEINELLPQFNDILRLLERVKELPLAEAQPIVMTENENEFREDASNPFEDPDAIVEQFPEKKDRYAKVPPNL